MRSFVDGVAFQVITEMPQQIGESDDVSIFPAASVTIAAHGEGATAVLNEEPKGRLRKSAVARGQGVTDARHELNVAWEKIVNVGAVHRGLFHFGTVVGPESGKDAQVSGIALLELSHMVGPCLLNVRVGCHGLHE